MSKKPRAELPAAAAHNTALAELLRARGFTASPESVVEEAGLAGQGKLLLRREKKGRGGKTVTVLSGLTLSLPARETLARELKKGLGCGAALEGDTVVLQGDIAPRAQTWLLAHGAKTVVIGN